MQNIIDLFAKQYGLTRSEIMAEIENVFSTMLSRWYRLEVMVLFRNDLQLEAVAYKKINGVIMQRLIDLTAIRGQNTLRKHLEKSLTRSAVLKQTRYYKSYEKELCWGDIIAHDFALNIFVETEIIPGQIVIAVCPLNRIGLHERNPGRFSIGIRRAFHVRRIDPVVLGDTPRLKIVVDRVSKKRATPARICTIFSCPGQVAEKVLEKAAKKDSKSAWLADAPAAKGHPDEEDIRQLDHLFNELNLP